MRVNVPGVFQVRMLAQAQVTSVFRHLLAQARITIEDRESVAKALSTCDAGIGFVDALHHASYRACTSVETFDDRKFARRAKKLGMTPAIMMLAQGFAACRPSTLEKSPGACRFGRAKRLRIGTPRRLGNRWQTTD